MAKELVVYFSVYGTAKIVAEEIAKQTGADIAQIEPVVPYDTNRDHYNALARLAKKEHDEDQRPAIKNEIDIEGYDRIYIGFNRCSIFHMKNYRNITATTRICHKISSAPPRTNLYLPTTECL